MEGRFYVYGAGKQLKDILEIRPEIAKCILAIFDRDTSMVGSQICGIDILDKSNIGKLPNGALIAISSAKYFDEIYQDIHRMNTDIECKPLMDCVTQFYDCIGACNVCHRTVPFWLKSGQNVTTKYQIIGNGRRTGTCPYCYSNDRLRWFAFVLKNFTRIYEESCKILHFAPETAMRKLFKQLSNIDYYSGDIEQGRADYVVDITNICFESEEFDYIIANHVLEHISDEAAAVNEMKRCLKPGGVLLLSFPYTIKADTIEENQLQEPEDRVYNYGQEDHVRLYGRDYKERLEGYDLQVEVYKPEKVLSEKYILKWKLIPQDIVLLCKKRND